MSLTLTRVQSERGAILIHAGLSLAAFMALTALVLDLGTLLVARRQAQNAADAGALAGATVVLFDDRNMDPTGAASGSAAGVAQKTPILNDAGTVDVTMAPSAPATCTSAIVNTCVQVAVQRNDLPTYFSRIFGLTSMSVQAVSTAKIMIANATACLKPWMLPDALPSGYTNDFMGTEIILDPSATTPMTLGYFREVDTGFTSYSAAIESCTEDAGQVFDLDPTAPPLPTYPEPPLGAFLTGVSNLIALDPGAVVSGGEIVGSCAPGCSPVSPTSPRLVVVGLFDPAEDPTGPSLHLTNFLSFFVEDLEPTTGILHGRIVRSYGTRKPQSPIPSDERAFLGIPSLVR